MRDNSFDRTIERNYLQKWRFLIAEYEAVKAGRSARFRRVGDFYRHHNTCSQTFRKYYNRYLAGGGAEAALLPQRRGPRWKDRREPGVIEAMVLAERRRGQNRYEIHAVLCERLDQPAFNQNRLNAEKLIVFNGLEQLSASNWTRVALAEPPSASTICRILRRHAMNRLKPPMREEKRASIKTKVGELEHVDLHRIPKDVFLNPPAKPVYAISLLDSCSRLAWAELVGSKKALPVMFKALKMTNTLNARYGVRFAEMLSGANVYRERQALTLGAEFCGRTNPENHPFEAMLLELGVKHRYTRPYRPQTNGKACPRESGDRALLANHRP